MMSLCIILQNGRDTTTFRPHVTETYWLIVIAKILARPLDDVYALSVFMMQLSTKPRLVKSSHYAGWVQSYVKHNVCFGKNAIML